MSYEHIDIFFTSPYHINFIVFAPFHSFYVFTTFFISNFLFYLILSHLDWFILLHRVLSFHPFTHSIDIYSKNFSLRGLFHFIGVVLLHIRALRYVRLFPYWFVSHCFIQSMF